MAPRELALVLGETVDAAGKRVTPKDLALPLRVERNRLARLQGDGEQLPVRIGGRGGAKGADLALPHHVPLVGAERVDDGVLVQEVERPLDHDRLELEQLAGLEAPQRGSERR